MPRLSCEFALALNIDSLEEVPSDSTRPKHWTLPFSKCFIRKLPFMFVQSAQMVWLKSN